MPDNLTPSVPVTEEEDQYGKRFEYIIKTARLYKMQGLNPNNAIRYANEDLQDNYSVAPTKQRAQDHELTKYWVESGVETKQPKAQLQKDLATYRKENQLSDEEWALFMDAYDTVTPEEQKAFENGVYNQQYEDALAVGFESMGPLWGSAASATLDAATGVSGLAFRGVQKMIEANPLVFLADKVLPESINNLLPTTQASQFFGNLADQTNRELGHFRSGQQAAIGEWFKDSPVLKALASAAVGGASNLATMGLAASTGGSAYVPLALAGLMEANQAYTEAKDQGMSETEAQLYAGASGLIEFGVGAIFQKLGLGGLESAMTGRNAVYTGVADALEKIGITTLQELPEENITEILHGLQKKLTTNPDMGADDFLRIIYDTTLQTTLMGAFGGGREQLNAFVNRKSRKAANDLPPDVRKALENIGVDLSTAEGREKAAKILSDAAKTKDEAQPVTVPATEPPTTTETTETPPPEAGTTPPLSAKAEEATTTLPAEENASTATETPNTSSVLDQFEAEQQERIKKRMEGDRRVIVVNQHPVTNMIEGKYANKRILELAIEKANTENVPVTYVEGDLENLGGLNKEFGNSGADKHFKAMADIAKAEFDKLGIEVAYTTKGGDEFGFTAIGATKADIDAVLDRIRPQIVQYVKENGLDKIKHTKEGRKGGTGINFSAAQYDPNTHENAESLIRQADTSLELEKLQGGKTDEQRQQTQAPGTLSPEGQPGAATEGTQQDTAAVQPPAKKPAARKPKTPKPGPVSPSAVPSIYAEHDRVIKSGTPAEIERHRQRLGERRKALLEGRVQPTKAQLAQAKEVYEKSDDGIAAEIRSRFGFPVSQDKPLTQDQENKARDVAHNVLSDREIMNREGDIAHLIDRAIRMGNKVQSAKAKTDMVHEIAAQLANEQTEPEIDEIDRMLEDIQEQTGEVEPVDAITDLDSALDKLTDFEDTEAAKQVSTVDTSKIESEIYTALKEQGLPANSIVVVQTQAQAEAMLSETGRKRAAGKVIRGFYSKKNDQIVIVAENVSQGAVKTALHELVGHRGVEAIPKVLEELRRILKTTDTKRLEPYAKQYGFDLETESGQLMALKEYIADRADQKLSSRVVLAIKRILAKIGFGDLTDVEVYDLLTRSRKYLQQQQRTGETDTVFDMEQDNEEQMDQETIDDLNLRMQKLDRLAEMHKGDKEAIRKINEAKRKVQARIDKGFFGRPDLANPGKTKEVRDIVDQVDEDRNEQGRPGRRSDVQVNEEADVLLQDKDNLRKVILEASQRGGQLNDAETLAAQKLINLEATRAYVTDDLEGIKSAKQLIDAYRDARAETARALRMGMDPNLTPEERTSLNVIEALYHPVVRGRDTLRNQKRQSLRDQERIVEEHDAAIRELLAEQQQVEQELSSLQNELAALVSELGLEAEQFDIAGQARSKLADNKARIRELRAKVAEIKGQIEQRKTARKKAKTIGDQIQRELERMDTEDAKKTKELRKALEIEGVDVDKIETIGKRPIEAADAIRVIQTHSATITDKLAEYWRNSILSAPATHARNLFSNTAFATWHLTAERITEALVNQALIKDPTAAQLGELKYLYAGMLPGLSKGLQNLAMSWRTERPTFEAQFGGDANKLDTSGLAIKGQAGRVIRAPQRAMMAMDELCKTVFAEMEVSARAYRIAKEEGLSGEAMSKRMAELQADLKSKAWSQALESARYLAFQNELDGILGSIGKSVMKFRKDFQPAFFLVPFITTPVNVYKAGIRRSPIGAIEAAKTLYDAYKTKDYSKVPARVAEQFFAWTAALALYGLAGDDEEPDSILVTGTRKNNFKPLPSQSIRIGGRWFGYSGVEPLATMLTTTLDMINGMKQGNVSDAVGAGMKSWLEQTKDKTFLRSIGDLYEAISAAEDESKLARWASNFGSSFMPNIWRNPSRILNGKLYETRVWGEDTKDLLGRSVKRMFQGMQIPFAGYKTRYDMWGREIETAPSRTAQMFQIFSPVRIGQDADIFIGDQIIMRYLATNKEERYPYRPRPEFSHKNVKYTMTDDEYEKFLKTSGDFARENVERAFKGKDLSTVTEAHFKTVTRIIERGRMLAKAELIKNRAKEKSK